MDFNYYKTNMKNKVKNTELNKAIGAKIRRIRKQNILTLEMLADFLDITPQILSKYEVGEVSINICILKKIFIYFNININEFFKDLIDL